MSLTSFIKNKDVKEKFVQEFPMPKFQLVGELKAPPKTKHYSLVGTAFDYLMRFYLKRINPLAVTQEWVAELSILFVANKKTRKKINEILRYAKRIYENYLKKEKMNEDVIKSCLLLAQLDLIYRAGYIVPNIGVVDLGDIQDMKNLIELVQSKCFLSKKNCLLNPTFGKASNLVGGADMDILLDDTLIDIKTTKFLKFKRDYFNQLVGYYTLFLIGGIDGAPKNTTVGFIGIYYSRHGILYKIAIDEVVKNCNLQEFIEWFEQRAEQEFAF